jgi:tetratricopeptide (TPR) repeat protein
MRRPNAVILPILILFLVPLGSSLNATGMMDIEIAVPASAKTPIAQPAPTKGKTPRPTAETPKAPSRVTPLPAKKASAAPKPKAQAVKKVPAATSKKNPQPVKSTVAKKPTARPTDIYRPVESVPMVSERAAESTEGKAASAVEAATDAAPNASEGPTPTVIRGVFKMKDLYQSGVEAYKEKDYERAIRYFERALEIQDPYTERYYYAEAHVLLGVIYQFYYPVPGHRKLAREHYEAALAVDPHTTAAKKHLEELSKSEPK